MEVLLQIVKRICKV